VICRAVFASKSIALDGADHLAMGMALIASTGGVGLLPAYSQNFLPSSVTSRPLKGDTLTIELVLGYKKSNESPILKLLLSRLDELVARVSKKTAKTRNTF
jgi:LysR family hca operon transcriptional activator